MDTFLAIASRRETRDYSARPIPDEIVDASSMPDASPAARRTASRGGSCWSRTIRAGTARRGRLRAHQRAGRAAAWSGSSAEAAWTPAAARRTCCSPPGTRASARARTGTRPRGGRAALGLADGEELAIVLHLRLPRPRAPPGAADRGGVERRRRPQAARRAGLERLTSLQGPTRGVRPSGTVPR